MRTQVMKLSPLTVDVQVQTKCIDFLGEVGKYISVVNGCTQNWKIELIILYVVGYVRDMIQN